MDPMDRIAGPSDRFPYRAVLLDWDNTLHDSAATHLSALRQVLAELGMSVDEATYRRVYTTDYRALYRRLGLPDGQVAAASERWRTLLAAERPRLLPGAGEALLRLAIAGVPLALVTSGPRETVLLQLARLGLADRFAATVYGDDQPPRPDPAPLRAALATLSVAPPEAAYCSDTVDDMRMGRLAGVHCVGISSFAHDATALLAAGADETAPSVAAWAERTLAARAAR